MDIQTLPKVSLHDHLDGGLRPGTIIELAERDGIALPSGDSQELAEWFLKSCSNGNLSEYLETFALTLSVMQKPGDLQRIALEFALDLMHDGVIYGEVRWAPEQHLEAGMSLQDAVDAVAAGFAEAEQVAAAQGHELQVVQILCAMRQNNRSLEIAKLALQNRHLGVHGFDLAGPEAGFSPDLHAETLDFLARNHFEVTLHAGEEGELSSVAAAVYNRALRLGHGTKLANDLRLEEGPDGDLLVELGELAEWVRDREIAIEACPSSNLQTASSPWGETLEDHPFDVFYQIGMRVTVNTDNRLMSATTLTRELELLQTTFGYDLNDIMQFQVNAALAAFLPLDERLELVERIVLGFENAK